MVQTEEKFPAKIIKKVSSDIRRETEGIVTKDYQYGNYFLVEVAGFPEPLKMRFGAPGSPATESQEGDTGFVYWGHSWGGYTGYLWTSKYYFRPNHQLPEGSHGH